MEGAGTRLVIAKAGQWLHRSCLSHSFYCDTFLESSIIKSSRKEKKTRADPEISPFLISMIPGTPAENIQPNAQITAGRRGVGRGWEGRTAPLLSAGQSTSSQAVLCNDFSPLEHQAPPAGDAPNLLPPPLLPVLGSRLHVSTWTHHLTPQTWSVS